jgi:hypothetical protein
MFMLNGTIVMEGSLMLLGTQENFHMKEGERDNWDVRRLPHFTCQFYGLIWNKNVRG